MSQQVTPPQTVTSPPYSSAIRVEAGESLLFVSGQLPIEPATGEMGPSDVGRQTALAMANAVRVVGEHGGGTTDIVKVGIFTTRINAIADINSNYLQALGDHRPARSLIEVSALPREALVEIELVARVPGLR
jgi:2-iminobutanoate/2-iminopropanoate deaminase